MNKMAYFTFTTTWKKCLTSRNCQCKNSI